MWRNGQQTTFVGLDAVRKIQYRTTRNESTRCNFCKNNCLRTFIDIKTADTPKADTSFVPIKKVTKVPLMHGEQRLIVKHCHATGLKLVHSSPTAAFGLPLGYLSNLLQLVRIG